MSEFLSFVLSDAFIHNRRMQTDTTWRRINSRSFYSSHSRRNTMYPESTTVLSDSFLPNDQWIPLWLMA